MSSAMADGSCKKSKLSWLVKKFFSVKNKDEEEFDTDQCEDAAWRSNNSERETYSSVKKSKTDRRSSERSRRSKLDPEASQFTDVNNHRVFVATWNVGGKSPPTHLNLEDWLHTSPPADIYVLGFQEIVPLNAGNVLGTEDNGPAKKWLALIGRTLNNIPITTSVEGYQTLSPISDPAASSDPFFHNGGMGRVDGRFSVCEPVAMYDHTMMVTPQPGFDRRFSVCEPPSYDHRSSDYDPGYRPVSPDDEYALGESPVPTNYSPMCLNGYFPVEEQANYCEVASKQMVGIFLTVWVKCDLRDEIRNLKVCCVERGLMGYLGNKGSISISISLQQTSFCFVCSHLTSGQKEGDELRRNSDVMEILRKTRFPRVDESSPRTILDHDRVIWLGDLNYRIALSYRSAKALVEMRNWRDLLENDQLRIEQRRGRVFAGWNEGTIYFPPTYKYSNNSDRYAFDARHPKVKRRTPAWCDRILWYGKGLHQLSYVRGESKFSDHRPVYSIFLVETNRGRVKKSTSCSSARIEVEELLPYSQVYHHDQNFY